MKILLVADHTDDARVVRASLTGDGHTVTTCNDRSGGPCRGVEHLDDCPLESSVDLAVVARSPHGRRGIEEMGSVCAARHRICRGYAARVATSIHELLQEQSFDVRISRHDRDVHVWIALGFAASPTTVGAVADRARAGVRRHDRFAQVIDVSVQHRPW